MKQKLITALSRISKVKKDASTGSTYFDVQGVKIRISDHLPLRNSKNDLCIFVGINEYMVFPVSTVYTEGKSLLTANDVVDYIKGFITLFDLEQIDLADMTPEQLIEEYCWEFSTANGGQKAVSVVAEYIYRHYGQISNEEIFDRLNSCRGGGGGKFWEKVQKLDEKKNIWQKFMTFCHDKLADLTKWKIM